VGSYLEPIASWGGIHNHRQRGSLLLRNANANVTFVTSSLERLESLSEAALSGGRALRHSSSLFVALRHCVVTWAGRHLFIQRNHLQLAHQVGRYQFQNGARGLGDSKKERKGCRGPCYRPGGPTPGGYFCLITPPYKVEGIQRGSSMSQRKKCGLGKKGSRGAPH